MPEATDQQVQNDVNQQVRPICEQMRALQIAAAGFKTSFDDVYAALTANPVTWTDNRTDGPPHLATASDVLAFNTFVTGLLAMMGGGGNANDMANAVAQWPIVLKLCVRPLQVS